MAFDNSTENIAEIFKDIEEGEFIYKLREDDYKMAKDMKELFSLE